MADETRRNSTRFDGTGLDQTKHNLALLDLACPSGQDQG